VRERSLMGTSLLWRGEMEEGGGKRVGATVKMLF
jgi:hypothetical protein